MNLMKHIVLIIGLTLAALSVQAQSNIVRGTVRDAKETLIGVNVVVMNKDNRVYTGISTDMNGGYMLKIPADLKDNLYITFSFIGYKTKKVEYKGQKVIDVTLEADAQLIDEVVVTGTASRNSMGVSYKNLTASVQRMEMKDVEELPVTKHCRGKWRTSISYLLPALRVAVCRSVFVVSVLCPPLPSL